MAAAPEGDGGRRGVEGEAGDRADDGDRAVAVRALAARPAVGAITGSATATGLTRVVAAPKVVTVTARAAHAVVTG